MKFHYIRRCIRGLRVFTHQPSACITLITSDCNSFRKTASNISLRATITRPGGCTRAMKKASAFPRQLPPLLRLSFSPTALCFLGKLPRTLSLRPRRKFQRRIRLSGNQSETSRNRGKSIQDPRSANTEAVSICSPLPSETQHRLQRITNFVCPFRPRGNFFYPSRRNTNYRLIYANTL